MNNAQPASCLTQPPLHIINNKTNDSDVTNDEANVFHDEKRRKIDTLRKKRQLSEDDDDYGPMSDWLAMFST